MVERIRLSDVQDQKVISTAGWSAGTYTFNLISDGKGYDSEKLIVVK